jgi:hypothetical protein
MRWIIPLSSLAVGLCVGLGVVVVRDGGAPALVPARFQARSEAQAVGLTEGEWGALWVGWRLRYWWPQRTDWPTP